ncbi:hypothetical protein MKSMC1_25650 [Mycobacterium kansasii]|nr:hypothetical protein MKSMC1_25650 [Mycobacterium kansasii]
MVSWDAVRERTTWHNVRFSVDHVADLLQVKPQSIRQYLAVGGAEGFPAPDDKRDGKNYWLGATIYDFIDTHRPHLRARIPRLYPLASSFRGKAATFLGAEHFEVRQGGWWNQGVLHLWQPSDDRGRVIVAYPDQPWAINVANDLARQIAGQRADSSTVVVVSDSESHTPDPLYPNRTEPGRHRGLGVCDNNTRSDNDALARWRADWSWSDLAYLLRTDVPYWPTGLLDMDAMASWRPGQVRKITPRYRSEYQISHFSSALVDACKDDSELLRLLGRACRIINYATAENLQLNPKSLAALTSQTGLLLAATPDIDETAPTPLTEDERARLLHLRADPHYAQTAHAIGYFGDAAGGYKGLWRPVIASANTIDRNQLGPLAQRWRERLRPLKHPRSSDELGFTWINGTLHEGPDRDGPHHYLVDPMQPDCWIVETPTRIYATTGSRLKHAIGPLQSIEIGVTPGLYKNGYAVFAGDGNGTPWIMPNCKDEPYLLGYDGSGPRALAIAIKELCVDINAELSGNDQFEFIGDREEPCGLRDLFIGLDTPTTLHRNDIDRLLGPV